MIPKQAIKKAIEGGWNPSYRERTDAHYTVLMPTFWQALGKASGWQKSLTFFAVDIPSWEAQALRFHRLILTGGDLDAYWKEVLAAVRQ